MATTAITRTDDKVIQTYGESGEILSLAKRIKIMVPGGNKLSDAEAQALAQVSLVTKCNPFIGEIWYIPGRGPMIGIKGARRHGNEQVQEAGGKDAYWTANFSIATPAEVGYIGDIKDLAAAWKVVIEDSVSTARYQKMFIETVNSLRSAGSSDPVGEAREVVGKRPQWIGYGYSTISEQSRMNKQALAMKRAEADGLKRKFYIPFGADVAAGDSAQEVDSRDWIEAPVSETEPRNPDPIDDAAWDKWLALCYQAEKVEVPYALVNRETTTKSDLRAGYMELERFVRDAKEQERVTA